MQPTRMPTPTQRHLFSHAPRSLRKWFRANHAKAAELWVGFYKKDSGKPSITWPESVDEALCVGWIDGIRKTPRPRRAIRSGSRPRRKGSIWSAVNIARVKVLTEEKRMRPTGVKAFAARTGEQVGHLRVRAAARSARRAVRGLLAKEQGGADVLRRAAARLPQADGVVDRQRQEGRDPPGAAAADWSTPAPEGERLR